MPIISVVSCYCNFFHSVPRFSPIWEWRKIMEYCKYMYYVDCVMSIISVVICYFDIFHSVPRFSHVCSSNIFQGQGKIWEYIHVNFIKIFIWVVVGYSNIVFIQYSKIFPIWEQGKILEYGIYLLCKLCYDNYISSNLLFQYYSYSIPRFSNIWEWRKIIEYNIYVLCKFVMTITSVVICYFKIFHIVFQDFPISAIPTFVFHSVFQDFPYLRTGKKTWNMANIYYVNFVMTILSVVICYFHFFTVFQDFPLSENEEKS